MPTPDAAPSAPSLQPRERLALHGEASLSDADLLAIVLGTGQPGEPVHLVAARLLDSLGGLSGLAMAGVDYLATVPGIGHGKASRLRAALELGKRISATPLSRQAPITSSRDVVAALRPRLRSECREHFVAIAVDARNRPLAEIDVAIGGLTACALNPADVFRQVLRWPAVGVLFVHNHPSGDATPSPEDIEITERLRAVGRLIGVQVLDHVILGDGTYFSFLDRGLFASAPGPAEPPPTHRNRAQRLTR